jgi:hypothetical protein
LTERREKVDEMKSVRMTAALSAARRVGWLSALLCILLPALHADGLRLTEQDLQGDRVWLESFGLKGATVLEYPVQLPLTRRSFIAPLSWYLTLAQARPELRRKEISADALREDLPLLQLVMQKAYGGRDFAEKRGWKWSDWFEGWDTESPPLPSW